MKNMKKQYVKPELYFENFELSTSIATCTAITTLLSKETSCAYNDGVEVIFLVGNDNCQTTDDGTGKYCYDVPNGENTVFSS